MDDMFAKMQEILSTEEGKAQLNSLADALGLNSQNHGSNSSQNNSNTQGGFDISQLASMLGQNANSQNNSASGSNSGGFDFSALSGLLSGNSDKGTGDSGLNLGALMGIQQMLGAFNQNDDINTNLLLALRPHFSDERKNKIDQAVKMLKLFTVLPLLKDSGILGNLLG